MTALAAATGTAKTPQAAECEASQGGLKGNAPNIPGANPMTNKADLLALADRVEARMLSATRHALATLLSPHARDTARIEAAEWAAIAASLRATAAQGDEK